MREANAEAERLDPLSARSLFGDDFADVLQQNGSRLQAFSVMASNIFRNLSKSTGNFGTIISRSFNSIGEAVGGVVKNFVLLGTAGTSMRKFASEVIASVAQMAAVKAIYEWAEAASVFGNFLMTGDPKWLAVAKQDAESALLYTAAAVAAAVGGRALAGNAFASAGGGGGGGSQSPSIGGNSSTNNQPQVIEQNRPALQPIIILRGEFEHTHKYDSSLGRMTTETVVKNLRTNGEIRAEMMQHFAPA